MSAVVALATPTSCSTAVSWTSGFGSCEETADRIRELVVHSTLAVARSGLVETLVSAGRHFGPPDSALNLGNTGHKTVIPFCGAAGGYQAVGVRPVALAHMEDL
eukprot:CAMPEP_0168427112 /NCGR_PEP_ID=MMETSP0228-20121227/36182_1 /TAXON_ID=133427 /ORGANISM="Protoceratium reticulatum, Strain CCCM 535 (=CCMP 1889)" /LENGTH=103 /DNA_ID=CAMNT_0008441147 /DNA_START=68 /DNA_END=380 /DNA_ORIENTATION=+